MSISRPNSSSIVAKRVTLATESQPARLAFWACSNTCSGTAGNTAFMQWRRRCLGSAIGQLLDTLKCFLLAILEKLPRKTAIRSRVVTQNILQELAHGTV